MSTKVNLKKRSPTYAVPALEKGLAIIEQLAVSPVPLGLAELAGRLKRGRQELFRMCACLEACGYIARDGVAGKWSLTLKLFALAHGHTPVERLLEAARAPMRDFAAECGESCHLSVADQGRLLVVAQEHGASKVRLSIEVGATFNLLETASGRLLLALRAPAAEGEESLARASSGAAISGAAQRRLRARLAEIRRAGRSDAEGETLGGVRDTAVPVMGPGGVVAALTCSRLVASGATEDSRIGRILAQAADAIGRKLGRLP